MGTRLQVPATLVVLALGAMLFSATAIASPSASGAGAKGSAKKAEEPLPPIETKGNCEFIANPGNSVCMLPFPDDYYTSADPGSPTGRRIAFRSFAVTEVENEPNPGEIARRVKGTFTVPCFLFPSCAPGGTMQLDGEGHRTQNGIWTANFDCIIPPTTRPTSRPGPWAPPRAAPAEQQLVSDFFDGAIQKSDRCGPGPCYAGSFTGP